MAESSVPGAVGEPLGLEADLHRRLREPGPLVTITKAQAAWMLECVSRFGGSPDPVWDEMFEQEAGGAVGEREEPLDRLRAARFVLDYWLTAYRGFLKTDTTFGIGTHPLNLVQAAMDGETDPAELGLPADLHDAFRRHISVNEGGPVEPQEPQ